MSWFASWAARPASFGVGVALASLLGLQLLVALAGTVRRYRHGWERERMERERLGLEIAAARRRCEEAGLAKQHWNGFRKFRVARKVAEVRDVHSLYLVPHDGRPLPPFHPGQYLTFQFQIPGVAKPVIRCYSLSDSPHHPEHYRVTIKRAFPPPDVPEARPGLASSYVTDVVREGDLLDVKAPDGHFHLDLEGNRPVVLIGGGVGITPVLSMLNGIVERGSERDVWFFLGVRNGAEHIQKEHVKSLAERHPNVRLHVCYSNPGSDDVVGRDYQHACRVGVDLFKRVLPSNNYEYYICGPGPMMKSVTDGLREWGVPDRQVFFEAFGPATVKKAPQTPGASSAPGEAGSGAVPVILVTFGKSGRKANWDPGCGSLLDFAEAQGIAMSSGCRAGSCGSCVVAVRSGEVHSLLGHTPGSESGTCLACVCQPRTDLVLDV